MSNSTDNLNQMLNTLLQLYYFSSGTSFYFVYDFCLFKNLSTQVSYALRYLPACVAAVVFTLIISVRYVQPVLQRALG